MTLMNVSTTPCPVPPDQRPLNEYTSLREECFFSWATLEWHPYLVRLLMLWSLAGVFCAPVSASSLVLRHAPSKFLLATAAGASFWLGLGLIRLYLGWSYVCDRLLSESVIYEETGWYDGQSWTKTAEELAQDRLIGIYQVQPIVKRLRYSLAGLGGMVVVGSILWQVC
jgi:hypothetical protein